MSNSKCDKTRPYAFVSYKSQDSEVVKSDIELLRNVHNVNVWFDEDLTAGRKWDDEVKPILVNKNCQLVIFYASPDAIASKNVQKEIKLAVRFRKQLLPINFYNFSFMDVYHDKIDVLEMKEKNANNDSFSIQGAIDLVDQYLPAELTFVVRGTNDYYAQITKSINRMASEIIVGIRADKQSIAAPAAVYAPTPTPAPVTAPDPMPEITTGSTTTLVVGHRFEPLNVDTVDYSNVLAVKYKDSQSDTSKGVFNALIKVLSAHHTDKFPRILSLPIFKRYVDSEPPADELKTKILQLLSHASADPGKVLLGFGRTQESKPNLAQKPAKVDDEIYTGDTFPHYFKIYENEYRYEGRDQARGMAKIFEHVLNRHSDKIDEICSSEMLKVVSFTEISRRYTGNSQRAYSTQPINVEGRGTLWVDTSFGLAAKRGEIEKLFAIVDEDPAILKGMTLRPRLPGPRISSSGGGKRGDFVLFGERHKAKDPTEAMVKAFELILRKHPNSLNEVDERVECVALDESLSKKREKTYFRDKNPEDKSFAINSRTVYIGTGYSTKDKEKKVAELLRLLGEDESAFTLLEADDE